MSPRDIRGTVGAVVLSLSRRQQRKHSYDPPKGIRQSLETLGLSQLGKEGVTVASSG